MNRALLLDSHVFYWLMGPGGQLGQGMLEAILKAPEAYVSAASVAELSIKHARGKLPLPRQFADEDFAAAIEGMGLLNLPLTTEAAARLRTLPPHHGDPFDRLLIAQALESGLTMVTHDRAFAAYEGLDILWA